jgi:hypothetical protein
MTEAGNHASGRARPFHAGERARVAGVPAHGPPAGMPLDAGEELTAVGYDERWPGYVLCGSLLGHTGWVPEGALLYLAPGIAVVRRDYGATVLAAAIGDEVVLQAESNGWYWAVRADGQAGWVLASHIHPLDEG